MYQRINHNHEKRMLSIDECCDYMGLGKTKVMEITRSIGAVKKIGSRSLYDKRIIDTYLDTLPCESGEL